MATATLTPYCHNGIATSFGLVSTSANGAKWMKSGRDIACPYSIEIQRKLTAPNANTNDHVVVRIAETERNATTGKLATGQILIDISIPKDSSIITAEYQQHLLGIASSLLNDSADLAATHVAQTALVEGRDL
jgi:hypothetical protein